VGRELLGFIWAIGIKNLSVNRDNLSPTDHGTGE